MRLQRQVAFYAPDGRLLRSFDGAGAGSKEASAAAASPCGEAAVVGSFGCLRAYAVGGGGAWEAGPPLSVRLSWF